jgi:hypothetical protein
MDEAEVALGNELVTIIGGTRPPVSPDQVRHQLSSHYGIGDSDVQVKHYSRANFLLIFASRQLADQVLHAPPPPLADFWLIFYH